MTEPTPEKLTSHQQALERCDELIAAYAALKFKSRIRYQVAQVSAILLSGLTPVLILWTLLPKPLLALPPALAAIAAGLNGIFQWKENWIRFAYTHEALKSEKVKYLTRTTKRYQVGLDDQRALENFVERVEAIVMSEVSDWRSGMLEAPAGQSSEG